MEEACATQSDQKFLYTKDKRHVLGRITRRWIDADIIGRYLRCSVDFSQSPCSAYSPSPSGRQIPSSPSLASPR